MGAPSFSAKGGGQVRARGHHLTAMNMLSVFGGFNQRGCCPLSADSTSGGGGGGLSAFG